MPSPAIVLMTDPARCSQSDVHHLLEALLSQEEGIVVPMLQKVGVSVTA